MAFLSPGGCAGCAGGHALEALQQGEPAWKSVPSWFVFGELDRNIPAAAQRFMAERAKARETSEIPGGSHVVGVTHADTVAELILRAAGHHTT